MNVIIAISAFFIYFLLFKLGSLFTIPFGFSSAIWPLSGVMLGLYLIYGRAVLFGTAAAATLCYSLESGYHVWSSYGLVAITSLSVLQLVIARYLLTAFCFLPVKSHRPLEIIKFLLISGPLTCLITSLLFGVLLQLESAHPLNINFYILANKWLGDAVSIIFITPVLLFLRPNEFVRRAKKPIASIITTLTVLFVIFLIHQLISINARGDKEAEFNQANQVFVKQFRVVQTTLEQNLAALEGLFQANKNVSAQQFEDFTRTIENPTSAVRAMAWLPLVETQQRAEFEHYLKQDQAPSEFILQATADGLKPAPIFDKYIPIKYTEPLSENKAAIGLDVLSHPVVGNAVQYAIDNKLTVISSLLSLAQQRDKSTGAIVYRPVYKAQHSTPTQEPELTGFVEIVLEIDVLLSKIKEKLPTSSYYYFQLNYGKDNVYQEDKAPDLYLFKHKVQLNLFDKDAELTFFSSPEFDVSLVNWGNYFILIITCIIGVLCVMFVFLIVTFNASLTRQVTDSTKRLVEQNQKLETANQAKNLFLANISHEYRTPLNAIIGFTEIAQNEIKDSNSLNYFNQINESSNLLLGIVNDVLDYSKMQAGELRLEYRPFNIRAASQSVIDILADKAEKKSIKLNFDFKVCTSVWVNADEVRYKQILINLLNNAIKFTEQGSIELICNCQQLPNSRKQFSLTVKDSGIGISEQALDELFKPFSQAESSTNRRFGGTGLGLSIVKQLCKLMNGSIEVKSEVGKGSEFTVTLPFELVDKPKELVINEIAEKFDYDSYKVLVVEDNKVNQLVISKHLERLNVQFELAEDGEQALEALNHSLFDLILMDLQMPVMDGFTASGLIKKNDNLKHIPIVILSASVGQGEKDKAKQLDIHDYIEKPFKQDELIRVFNKYLVKA